MVNVCHVPRIEGKGGIVTKREGGGGGEGGDGKPQEEKQERAEFLGLGQYQAAASHARQCLSRLQTQFPRLTNVQNGHMYVCWLASAA